MNLRGRGSVLLFGAIAVTLLMTIVALPYGRFGWRTALAEASYGGDPVTPVVPEDPTAPVDPLPAQTADKPAYEMDPLTDPSYTDSNGGLTSGKIYSPIIAAANVGDEGVIARGFIGASDFQVIGGDAFAPFPSPVRACVRGIGNPVFIPKTATGDALPVDLPAAPSDTPEVTCVFIFQPGIVVLVQN